MQKGWSSNWTTQLKLLPFSKESIAKPDIFMWFMVPVVFNHKWQSRLIDCTTFNLILGSSLSKAFFGRWYNICARHQVWPHTLYCLCELFLHNGMEWIALMVWLDYDTNDNLSTNCVQFVLVFVLFLSKICHNKTTTKFVICQILYKNKTKQRQFVDNLSFVLLLSCFCPKLDKWQIFLLFLLWQILDKN